MVGNVESSLALQLSDIAARVGDFLGFGKLTTGWTGWVVATPYTPDSTLATSQLQQIMDSIAQGLRWFYSPTLVDKSIVAHKWSFLSQLRAINIVPSVNVYALPDDYGGLDGELTYAATANRWITIRRTSIGKLNRELQHQFSMTQAPSLCAVYLSAVQGVIGQRWVVAFAPIPDTTYTVTGQFRILPQMLTAAKPFPMGGEQHAETIMEACLAAAEAFYNDSHPGSQSSTHQALFKERLMASISQDVQENVATNLGYNEDRSDGYDQNWRRYYVNEPMYNGVPFSQL